MSKGIRNIVCVILALFWVGTAVAGEHPSLLMTRDGVEAIRASRGTLPLFDRSLEADIAAADRAIEAGIHLPAPKDGGGGYSHEAHKQNYYAMYYCGIAWQLTGEARYARFVADMLDAYADFYPALGYHPVTLSKTPGRIFWQTLNECVWLVHTSIAYDCVYEYLTTVQREKIEGKLLRPMSDFIMDGTPDNTANNGTFNRMHNHGTWATAAVGMAGLAMGEESYVRKALYGTDLTGKNGGFLMQMDNLFSPDGYFTEGAYYQRYAIWPFMLFAQAVDNAMPQLDIFNYRGRILEKALDVLLQLAYDGQFMKINDALDKGYDAQELIYAVDIIYKSNPAKKQLLSVARDYQRKFLPTDAGYAVARDLSRGEAEPLRFASVLLRDGARGDEGAVAILRSGDPARGSALVFKATSHGLSHGHYDKLNLVFYDNGRAVLPDYGAARFVNIEAKYKGHYTPENKTFAMSTIAHNTVVVDGQSHYGGHIGVSSKHHPVIYLSDLNNSALQVVSAVDSTAYAGVRMQRTLVMAGGEGGSAPLVLDLFRVESDREHTLDYPLHYNGHVIGLSFPYTKATDRMEVFGDANGYQHLWVEASGKSRQVGQESFTWFEGNRFYTATTAVSPRAEFYLVRAGANDPDFHLRAQAGYVIREQAARHTFATVIQPHGSYDPSTELVDKPVSDVAAVRVLADSDDYTVVEVALQNDRTLTFCLANRDSRKASQHRAAGKAWAGPYQLEIK